MSDASDKLCFLVVDDQPLITGALSMLLTSENPDSEVFTANSVDDARKLVHSHAPEADLLILDLSMPGVVGTSLLEEFVREEPSLKILVLSGVTDRESVMNTLSLGAAGFVPKTLDTDLLLTAIHFVLKTGLPAELIPQMFVPCLTTGVIIPALCRIVNSFFGIFCKKIPAGEMPFPAGKMAAKKLTLLRSAGRRSAVRHGSGSPQGPWSEWLRAACRWRCTRHCTASTDRPRSCWRCRESRSRSSS